ncbi:hypothetical protein SLS58_003099 [Diplodia intermedia]|uniref:Inositol polyphosphate-related phosphatase domain-containing protein n=1 Tax=Diplodia intermedia TaxID=856260 RepID=A0ABR3TWU9_9PEZI
MLLYLVTFNLARALVDPQLLGQTLLDGLPHRAPLPDVIVCSLQEVSPVAYAFLGGSYLTPYFDRITKSVAIAARKHADDENAYRTVILRHVGMTAIVVFAKPDVAARIRWIQTAAVGVGFMETGHKGAVGVRLALATHADSDDEVEMTFVAAHLAPMEDSVQRRLEDWEHIVRNLVFEPAADHAASQVAGARATASEGDAQEGEQEPLISPSYASGPASALRGLYTPTSHVFFAGDLNFRTRDTCPAADDHRTRFPQPARPHDSPQHYSQLLATDQLNRERAAGRILQGFDELAIAFPPTYKYSTHLRPDPITDPTPSPEQSWAWAKHRWPSWCDRILFLPPPLPQTSSSPSFSPLKYTSLPLLPSSDHQPVALALDLSADAPLAPPAKDADDDVRTRPPFPLNPDWRARRDAARRREIAFGVLAYLTWTYEGNVVLVALVVGALGVGAVARSFG